jgi:hypothetical protein
LGGYIIGTRRPKRQTFEYRARVRRVPAIVNRSLATYCVSYSYVATPTIVAVTGTAKVSVSYSAPPQVAVVTLSGGVTVTRSFGYHAEVFPAFLLGGQTGLARTFAYTGTPSPITLQAHTQYVAALNLRDRWREDNELFGLRDPDDEL